MALNPFAKAQIHTCSRSAWWGRRWASASCRSAARTRGRLGAVAAKVGLSGRAVALVPDEASAARAQKGAAQAGVLIEVEVAPMTALPVEDAAFDVAVVDDTGGLVAAIPTRRSRRLVGELFRILRPGGRVMVLGAIPAGGLGALVQARTERTVVCRLRCLARAAGSRRVSTCRTLAERDGLIFVEAAKPRRPVRGQPNRRQKAFQAADFSAEKRHQGGQDFCL